MPHAPSYPLRTLVSRAFSSSMLCLRAPSTTKGACSSNWVRLEDRVDHIPGLLSTGGGWELGDKDSSIYPDDSEASCLGPWGALCCTHSIRLTDLLQQGPSFPLVCFLYSPSVLPRVTSQVSYLYLNPISDLALREPRHNTGRSVFLPHL